MKQKPKFVTKQRASQGVVMRCKKRKMEVNLKNKPVNRGNILHKLPSHSYGGMLLGIVRIRTKANTQHRRPRQSLHQRNLGLKLK